MTVSHDGRQDVVEVAAYPESALLACVSDVEDERDIYRTMVLILLEQVHGDAAIIKRQRATIRRDREENRRLRQRVRLTSEAAA